jgi:hypothetical protein
MTSSYRVQWETLIRNPDPTLAFREHFIPLVTTDEGELVLADIADQVTAMRVEEGPSPQLVFTLATAAGEAELGCWPPLVSLTETRSTTLNEALRLHSQLRFPRSGPAAARLSREGCEPSGSLSDEVGEGDYFLRLLAQAVLGQGNGAS